MSDTHQENKNDGACLPEGYDWSQKKKIEQALFSNSQVEALIQRNKELYSNYEVVCDTKQRMELKILAKDKEIKELKDVISSALTELNKVDYNHKITAGQDYHFPRQALNRAREVLRIYGETK